MAANGSKATQPLAILVVWIIWKQKNDRVFQLKEKSVDKVISEIQDEARLWTRAGAKHLCPFVVDVDHE